MLVFPMIVPKGINQQNLLLFKTTEETGIFPHVLVLSRLWFLAADLFVYLSKVVGLQNEQL